MNSRSSMTKMGKHIAEARKSKGYTQKNLGDIIDVSDKTISKWEKGVVAPDITILNALAKALDISIEELLLGEKVEEENVVEAIDVYTKISKRKILKIFAVVFIALSFLVILIYGIEKYYSWNITPLNSVGDISSSGYIISNSKESKVMINKLFINNEIITPNFNKSKISLIKIVVQYNDDTLYYEEHGFDEPLSYQNVLNNYTITFDASKKIKAEKMELVVTLYDLNNEKCLVKIFFNNSK